MTDIDLLFHATYADKGSKIVCLASIGVKRAKLEVDESNWKKLTSMGGHECIMPLIYF